ncbi:uncharacterized protein LOC111326979 [Stylophora pistillata]|uniref:E3 ubiquitin-protein ligase DZIP3 n=1 Tax=Stylophora pistillata TaxID=50429 RepID=A0A2B4SH37_STYPI|nr:uncharacterized protein LOC111326979 [Stylophora pistillata]PFX27908.1 E3 ubiquitin-protein ligase DZIP3 [Stylophora pistillata]
MAAGGTSSPTSASPSGPSVVTLSKEKTNGTRLARLLFDEGTNVLREFLQSTHPGPTLKHALDNSRPKLEGLRRKRIPDEQWEKLFPSSGNPPDPKKFDIILLHLLLREVCHLKIPSTGWHKMPADADASPEASIVRIKCYRNELCHSYSTGVPNDEFEDKWNKISSSLEVLEVAAYRKKLQSLKSATIDHETRLLEEELEQWRREKELEKSGKISELSNCLPDDIPEEHIIGRGDQIQDIKDEIQSGTIPVIQITGGPGFGKTTVAKRVAFELAKAEDQRSVLFCSLLSKTNFNEATMEMINSCRKVVNTQVQENPGQWLKDWSKQIQNQVTFVLDNADGVIESEDRESFLNFLRDVRSFSRQNVTFVITSRRTFQTPDLPSKEVRLDPLSNEQARNLLLAQVQNVQEFYKAERIVELCGYVPLALCIVGSLLSDYTEETLVKNLENEPLAVLEDDQLSVEKAIKTSFDLLTEAGREALVLMSTFQGSFDSVAAEAVMKACSIPGIQPIPVIRSLKKSSLIEQPSSRRYQMHPLIHSYARKIGQAKHADLLARGEKLACVYFMSRLADNAELYWKRDSCKKSLSSFNKDRSNFEHFLGNYARGRREKDEEIMEGSQTLLESFPQKCMYLEKCLHPKNYAQILEQLLDTFDSTNQPVHVVELLCLLGHECRKKDQKKYSERMETAEEIYRLNAAKFRENPLSEVYFHNSYARYLSDKKDPKENKRIEKETQSALDVSVTSLCYLHPETAATLLLSGTNAKRRKQFDTATQQLTEALELFKRCLGKHFMTAEALKALADLFFFRDGKAEGEDNLTICIDYYKAAIEMFDDLGEGGSKESILTLKNFAIYNQKRGSFDEAMNILKKAEPLAERELEEKHEWKVSIKTTWAILHDEMGNTDKAKEMMLEGLSMAKELNLSIEKMRNKVPIRSFINRYPKEFPETEFPRGEKKKGKKEIRGKKEEMQ